MAKIAAIPMILTALCVFVGGTLWTVVYSFTSSKLLPKANWVGLDQYERLWNTNRWIVSIENLMIYGICSLVFSLVIGFVLAALLDQKIRFENTFRTIILYPFALSFIVTGLVWQWILNPDFGVQNIVRSLGWASFEFDPLYNQDIVIYGILIAGLWQGTGLIMVLMLAGLRGIDQEIWKAARVDGIPTWKTYIFIVIPMMRPGIHHHPGADRERHSPGVRSCRRPDQRRAGDRFGSAGEIRLRHDVPAPEPRAGLRRIDNDASCRGHRHHPLGLSRIREPET